MRQGILQGGRHAVVAGLYALAYIAARHVGGLSWIPLAGLRLTCLLLVPTRYWPALLAGEMIPLAWINYRESGHEGVAWLIAMTIPPLALAMPIVTWMRQWLPGLRQPIGAQMGKLLVCAMVVSTIWILNSLLIHSLNQTVPANEPVSYVALMAFALFLGFYQGILVIVPPALALVQGVVKAGSWRMALLLFSRTGLLWQSALLCLVMGALIVTDGLVKDEHLHTVLLVGFFVPVIYFALRYGWQGAAIAGAAANIGIAWIMPTWDDFATLVAQSALVLLMITLLMLGARTSVWRQSVLKTQESLLLARQELYLNELKMRHASQELEQVHSNLQFAHGRLMHRMRNFLHGANDESYRNQFAEARRRLFRLADSLSPREWHRLGHPSTLWTGPIADVLEEIGVIYDLDIQGELHRLSAPTNMALYRLGCEAVTFLMMQAPTDRVTLHITTKDMDSDGLLVKVMVESDGLPIEPPLREKMISGLGATGLSVDDMRNRAGLYHGELRIESNDTPGGARMMISLGERVEDERRLKTD